MAWAKRQQKRVLDALAARNEAQRAVDALPEDVPEETRKIFQATLAEADVAVARAHTRAELGPGTANLGRVGLVGLAFLVLVYLMMQVSSAPSSSSSQRIRHSAPIMRTLYPGQESAFAVGASVNKTCQRQGYVGAIIEDFECIADAIGDCQRANLTFVCTNSRDEHQQNIRKLQELARQ